jgi:acetoacetate decarboxylase
MGFVKTAEEIQRIQEVSRRGRFVNAQMLSVEYLTIPEVLSHALPPPLTPASEPRVTAMVGRWQSNCVGDFDGAALYLACRWGEIEGDYVLAMWMSTDKATIFGRDLYGEPKKISSNELFQSRDRVFGYVDRDGTRIMELECRPTTELGSSESQSQEFNFKARPASTGVGLEEDAILTVTTYDNSLTTTREGPGAVRLRSTVHDPVEELQVVQTRRASYIEGELVGECRSIASTPADVFLPYHYGRHDDWAALDTETTTRSVSPTMTN